MTIGEIIKKSKLDKLIPQEIRGFVGELLDHLISNLSPNKTNEILSEIDKSVKNIDIPKPDKVEFPDVQKVEVINESKFPDKIKVEVTNQKEFPKIDIPKVEFPKVQKVFVENQSDPTDIDLRIVEDNLKEIRELVSILLKKDPEGLVKVLDKDGKPVDWDKLLNKPTTINQGSGYSSYIVSQLQTLNAKDFATSAKQDTSNTKLDTLHADLTAQNLKLQEYKPQETDDYTTTNVTYVGCMKSDGTWLIKKLDETGNFLTIRFANLSNNGTLTTYATAWSGRVSATYNYLNILTNL